MGITEQTIYTWLHNGEIPAFHVANRWIIRKSQLRQKLRDTSIKTFGRTNVRHAEPMSR
ncbi:helix-turn-helix domain-containing protein [Cryobacterium sp. 10C3]